MSPTAIRYRLTPERIAIMTFDRPGSSANIFDRATLEELGAHLERLANEPPLRGLVLISGKASVFHAGADLRFISSDATESEMAAFIELGQVQMNRLAALAIPKVAAIHGACMGGGLEVCLACDYRLASNAPATRLGLPETAMGLLPAWGGLTRLPRLIGLELALDMVLGGKPLTPEAALRCGLVNEVTAPEKLEATACQRILTGQVVPGCPNDSHRLSPAALHEISQSRRQRLLKETRGHNPALLAALEVAVRAREDAAGVSLAREKAAFMEVIPTESTRNLLRFFFLKENARKLPKEAALAPLIGRVGIVGAGTMGAGIGYWVSSRGCPVILKDADPTAAARGRERIAQAYAEAVKRSLLSQDQAREALDRVSVAETNSDLAGADLIIEAIAEDLSIKEALFKELGKVVSTTALLATNTSSLSVSEIANATPNPQRVLGLHFFNPVARMPLVEVIAGLKTSPEALQRARRFVHQIGKMQVLSQDSPGFMVNRVLFPYLLEAVRLLRAGCSAEEVDGAMLEFGMAMGPLRVIDEVGLDVTLAISQRLCGSLGDRFTPPDLLGEMQARGKLGRKAGEGFYGYRNSRAAEALSAAARPRPDPPPSSEDFISAPQQRMVLLMVNEAARCLEEKVVAAPTELDFSLVIGAGFPSFRGGPLRYADCIGLAKVVDALDRWVGRHGTCFAPCKLLRTLAEQGKSFYP